VQFFKGWCEEALPNTSFPIMRSPVERLGPGIARDVQKRREAGRVVCVEELSWLFRQVGFRKIETLLGRRGACVPAPVVLVAAGEVVMGLVPPTAALPTQPRIVGPYVYCVGLSPETFGRGNPAVLKLLRYEF
jgi:hypothetical protein